MGNLKHKKPLGLLLGLVILLALGVVAQAEEFLLQTGDKGSRVIEVQSYLYQLHYLRYAPTGYYGKCTTEAVKSFQIEYGLTADGKTGNQTLESLRQALRSKNTAVEYLVLPEDTLPVVAERFNASPAVIMARNNLPDTRISAGQKLLIPINENPRLINSRSRLGGIQALPWSIVDQLWKNGEVVRIIDLETGKSFLGRRFFGYYHSDTEPLTKEDTRIMKEIYGGTWSWRRRAVVVQIRNLYVAASINGMPHGRQAIYDNDFQGQFCTHFLGSKIHKNGGSVDPLHQTMVQLAAEADLTTLLSINQGLPANLPPIEGPSLNPNQSLPSNPGSVLK